VRGGEGMQILARALLGFAVLIVVASTVIVAGTVYLGEGPQGEYQPVEVVPAAAGSQTSTGGP
jgi:hypothetical protein